MSVPEGWVLDPDYRMYLAHGGDGCIISFPEAGALPLRQYTRPMHPDDVAKYGFPHERAEHEPLERLLVCERPSPKRTVYMGSLTDGYKSVAAFGVYMQALLAAR